MAIVMKNTNSRIGKWALKERERIRFHLHVCTDVFIFHHGARTGCLFCSPFTFFDTIPSKIN